MVEDLNKTQLVLLTLLVSFVTSIATGIITFSLLQEAPPTVTQTINRVVEQTIQQVTPTPSNPTPQKVTTVVVKEDDEVISSIAKNTGSIVRIYNNDATPNVDQFYGIGVVLSKNGLIMTSAGDSFSTNFTYNAVFPDKSSHTLAYLGREKNGSIDFFKVAPDPASGQFTTGVPAVFSSENSQLGQTLVLIEGETKNVITIGHVSDLVYADPTDTKTEDGVELDTAPKTSALGGPLLNLSGQIVAFRVAPSTLDSNQKYLSSVYLSDAIASYLKK